MLTPAFELSQDDDFVIVLIKTPYVKISEVDFFINGHEFKFHVKPYFLRLNLPGKVVEDGREEASYDIEKGTFTVKLPKLQKGEEFEGLDMLTTLLAPTKKNNNNINKPLIEVMNDESINSDVQEDCNDDEMIEFNWEIEQELPEDEITVTTKEDPGKYGFANKKSGIFCKRQEELYEIADVPDPESITLRERRLARLAAEDMKFDPDHYLADYFDEETMQPFLDYSPPWNQEYQDSQNGKEPVVFTEEEKDKLRHLPNKEYLLDDQAELSILLGLVDVVFAYAYNHRTTEGDNTVESPWTINKLSSTLCYFETFTNINDVITASFRRCLSYPLYRHWELVQHVLDDTRKIFMLGRRRLVKCLLEIQCLFNEDDPRFLLNDLYITDYCVWLQKTSGKKLRSLAKTLQKIQITKNNIGWQLDELEKAAMLVAEAESYSETSDTSDTSDSENDDDDDSSEHEEENEVEIEIGKLLSLPDLGEKSKDIVEELNSNCTKLYTEKSDKSPLEKRIVQSSPMSGFGEKRKDSVEEFNSNYTELSTEKNEEKPLEIRIGNLSSLSNLNEVKNDSAKEYNPRDSELNTERKEHKEFEFAIGNLSLLSGLTKETENNHSVGELMSNDSKLNTVKKEEEDEEEDGGEEFEIRIGNLSLSPGSSSGIIPESSSTGKKIVVLNSTTF